MKSSSSSRRLRAETSDRAVDVILRVLTTRCRWRAELQPDKRLVLVAAMHMLHTWSKLCRPTSTCNVPGVRVDSRCSRSVRPVQNLSTVTYDL